MFRMLCLGLLLGLTAAAAADEPRTRVLLIGKDRDHPFGTHEYMTDCKILAKCLEQTPGIEAIVSNGWPTDAKLLDGVKAIVLHNRNGGSFLLSPPVRRQAEELLNQGVGLTAIHWSTGADKEQGEDWLKISGGWFSRSIGSRLAVTTTKLMQAAPDHPICRGWKDYDLRDEYYLDLRFAPEITPVMKVEIGKEEHTVGWVHERPGGGRSFGFVCGHFHANFGEPAFRKAIVNGILWTAHREIPEAGAPITITPQDMELPPDTRKKN